eukprot:1005075_1
MVVVEAGLYYYIVGGVVVAMIIACGICCYCLKKDVEEVKTRRASRHTSLLSHSHSAYHPTPTCDKSPYKKQISMQQTSVIIETVETPKIIPNKRVLRMPKSIFSNPSDKQYRRKRQRRHLPIYTMDEVGEHNSKDSCWIIANNLVLDVTRFIKYHPGGEKSIIKNGGFMCDKHLQYHSSIANKLWWKFVIGRIQNENDGLCILL